MRLFKLFTTALLLGLIGTFFYENADVFRTNLKFTLDLFIREEVKWDLPLYSVLLITLFIGFLGGVACMVKPFIQMRRARVQERHEKESAIANCPPAAPPADAQAGIGAGAEAQKVVDTEKK